MSKQRTSLDFEKNFRKYMKIALQQKNLFELNYKSLLRYKNSIKYVVTCEAYFNNLK